MDAYIYMHIQGILQVQQLEGVPRAEARGEGARRPFRAHRHLRGRTPPLPKPPAQPQPEPPPPQQQKQQQLAIRSYCASHDRLLSPRLIHYYHPFRLSFFSPSVCMIGSSINIFSKKHLLIRAEQFTFLFQLASVCGAKELSLEREQLDARKWDKV